MVRLLVITAVFFLICGCSDDEENTVQQPKQNPWGVIKIQIAKKAVPDLDGLKESKEKYKSRYEAIVKGAAEEDLQGNVDAAKNYCMGIDWGNYAEKNNLPDAIADKVYYRINCQVGAFLAISFSKNINEKYKKDSAVHLLNILTDDIGVGKISLSMAMTEREDFFQKINTGILQGVYNVNTK